MLEIEIKLFSLLNARHLVGTLLILAFEVTCIIVEIIHFII